MAALGWLTPRRRSATARSVLAGEAAAEAAQKSALTQPAPASCGTAPRRTGEPAFPVAGDDRAAAFFDLDNTVMQGAAIFHFGRGLYKRKFFQRRELARFAWQQAWFRLAGVEDPEHMQDARDSALSIVKGHRVAELMSIGEEIYDEYMAERIWPGTRALAQAHLDAGQKVWLVTAAPVETATIIARRLGPDRRPRHRRRVRRRRLHRPARRRAPARPGEGRGGTRAGRGRGPGPGALRRVQRLAQRHPDAVARRPPATRSTRTPSCASTPAPWTGGCATTAPAARRPRSASRPRPASAPWRAARPPPSPSTAAAADARTLPPPAPTAQHPPRDALVAPAGAPVRRGSGTPGDVRPIGSGTAARTPIAPASRVVCGRPQPVAAAGTSRSYSINNRSRCAT